MERKVAAGRMPIAGTGLFDVVFAYRTTILLYKIRGWLVIRQIAHLAALAAKLLHFN